MFSSMFLPQRRLFGKTVATSALTFAALLAGGCAQQPASAPVVERTYYAPWEQEIGYAQVVRAGNTLYISGTVSGGDTAEAQIDGVYGMLKKILAEHGASTSDILKEVIYTTDIEALKAAIPARKQYFPDGKYPSASWVQVDRLYSPEVMLEVEVVARLPD